MAYHPTNLFLRFILEVTAWISMGLFGWQITSKPFNFLLMLIFPFTSILIWGIFNVPGDPSRSGRAPIIVHGVFRLILELLTFGFGVWSLYSIGYPTIGIVFSVLVILHYLISLDRIKWLLNH